jgi:hypothetical protein
MGRDCYPAVGQRGTRGENEMMISVGDTVVVNEPPDTYDTKDYRGCVGVVSHYSYGHWAVRVGDSIVFCKSSNLKKMVDENETN